ncbi:TetR/AcrR family transcriptional regulator [Kribbella sp. NBC_01484]|uniref:TetR/AcrR family transcriptional regulator n=1 Tax=Kribbella sp. NBC_01484 TaxID=2903579 RepID=UPI002E3371CF|nr:TetR/AcrR family transcriptional regulator [Kribbella sp. NBC_01484]
MPRVSEEYLEQRRREVLAAARACFIRKGFHATSMRDVVREAELSAGAVYHYFPKKNDLVTAIARENLAAVADTIELMMHRTPLPPLDQVIGEIFTVLQNHDDAMDVARLALQVWGEAARSPELAVLVQAQLSLIREAFTRLARGYRREERLAADVPAEAVGAAMMALLPGFFLQRVMLPDVTAQTLQSGLQAVLAPSLAQESGGMS